MARTSAEPPAQAPSLADSLLRAPVKASERRPASPWVYPLWGILFVSAFVLYHASVLVVWNTPGKGLAKEFHASFLKSVKGYEYFRGTRNNQSWAMFAPNPTRANVFIRVYVEDQNGELWDFEQDIWGDDRYPYFFYDRRGKVNRRIDDKKTYQRIYGAWVCREWERLHDGEPAKTVSFVKRWTRVPHSHEVIANGGWNQWEDAEVKQKEQETITCKTVTHGQLPNELRERYGLPLLEDEDEVFKPVKHRTWWTKLERERAREERDAQRAADREKRDAERDAKKKATISLNAPIDARGPVRGHAPEPEPEHEPEPVADDEEPDQ